MNFRDLRLFLFDFFQDSMAFSQHKYKFNARVAEAIQERHLVYPLHFSHVRNELLGDKGTESVFAFLQLSASSEDWQFVEWYLSTLELPEYVPDEDYLPLRFWHKPVEVLQNLNTLVIQRAREGFSSSVVYIGEKGSGKSHTINCWLAENTKSLNQEKILWLYADGYKLYEIWKSQSADEQKLVTVDEFFQLRLVYIIAKNKEKSAFLRNIYKEIVQSSMQIYVPKKTGTMIIQGSIAELFEQLVRDIEGYERNRKHFRGIEAEYYTYVLRESQRQGVAFARAKERWLALARATEDFLLEKGYKILKVLDGMDNVNIEAGDELARSLYSRALEQSFDFISKKVNNIIRILVVRERTFIDIFKFSPLAPERPNGNLEMQLVKIRQPAQELEEIYNRRMQFILKHKLHFPKGELSRFVEGNLSVYEETVRGYFPHWLSSSLFHNNVSNFLYNTLTLFLLLYYRWLQQGKPNLREYDIRGQMFHYFSRNLFLNGHFFLNSEARTPNLSKVGVFSFSPFYVELRYQQEEPTSALVHVFLLQLLDQEMEFSEQEVVEILKKRGHNEELILSSIELCREYGLIDSLMSVREKVYIKTSAKGKSLLNLIFSSIDLLYIFSLDTYVPQFFIEENYIQPYRNKILRSGEPIKTKYAVGAIKSSVSFLSYLLQLGRIFESQIVKGEGREELTNFGFPLPIYLGNILRLVRRFENLYTVASAAEKEEIEAFFNFLRTK